MGSAVSRDHSARHPHRRKLLLSLKPQPTQHHHHKRSKSPFSASSQISQDPTYYEPPPPSTQGLTKEDTNDSLLSSNVSANELVRPVRPPASVTLVKHQVVLSDHVPPLSSLSAVSVPKRKSLLWRKSLNLSASSSCSPHPDAHSMLSSSSYYEDGDDDVVSSPRTSLGSDDKSNKKYLSVVDDFATAAAAENKKKERKKASSFTFSVNKAGNIDIVFESNFNGSNRFHSTHATAPTPHMEDETPTLSTKNPLKPFWSHNTSDDKEYDR
ncbi:hypothetical protein BDF20DRAFT_875346 [Mycotypha africana]|uniref:uncharacterized protein n=1 Tax=Mycotypha africana TaxID=64632 RepID=UPI002301A0DD|nr:uncharacterized protein BDF20DRAFT_875346 [Mycotypha africana]KAI8977524.1 hypothetical protein BDF20DRAFT_875346 [Mycotypha africana]